MVHHSKDFIRGHSSFTLDLELLSTQRYAKLESNQDNVTSTDHIPYADICETATLASIATYPTATPSWRGSVDSGGNRVHSAQSFSEIELFDGNEKTHAITVLLDTGAFSNCISKRLWQHINLKAQTGKHPKEQSLRLGNDSFVRSTLGVKAKWRFKGKTEVYHFYFYVVADLTHDLILSGPSIFKHEFLRSNPEICALYLKGDLRTEFEDKLSSLTPLGLPRLWSGKHTVVFCTYWADLKVAAERRNQDERANRKGVENEQTRSINSAEITRLAEEKRSKMQSNPALPSQSSGPSSHPNGSASA